MCWRSLGKGPPLVLLHGGHGSWLHWARNIESLAHRFTVWAPDLPGYGGSDLPPQASLDSLVAMTAASLNGLIGPQCQIGLAGFSFGALVAAHLANQRGHVRQLVLLGPAGHGGARRPRGELQNWRPAFASGDIASLQEIMRQNLRVHMLHEGSSIDALALAIHRLSCLRARFHSRAISRAGGLWECLQSYPGAARLAWGEHDVTADPESLVRGPAAGHANAIISGAGHWVQYERPGEINRLLLESVV